MNIFGLEIVELIVIAVCALGAQVIGGIAGYGTGLLMPLVLIPIIGAEAIVPVISLSALITNPTRVVIFREHVDVRKALVIAAFAIPFAIVGAWGYTLLTGRGAAFVIGTGLVALVPLRRYLASRRFVLSGPGVGIAGAVYGFLSGATTGVGVLLIAMLMAMGLSGVPVIATDALASALVGVAKTGVFFAAGELPAKLCLIGVLIGVMATPGTLIAKWIATRMAAKLHEQIIEATIVIGGLILIGRALMGGT